MLEEPEIEQLRQPVGILERLAVYRIGEQIDVDEIALFSDGPPAPGGARNRFDNCGLCPWQ